MGIVTKRQKEARRRAREAKRRLGEKPTQTGAVVRDGNIPPLKTGKPAGKGKPDPFAEPNTPISRFFETASEDNN